MATHTNTPRLTINAVAVASGLARATVVRRLNEAREAPDSEGKFTLAQAVRGLLGGLAAAKLRRAEAEAGLAEIELKKAEGRFLDAAVVEQVWADLVGQMRPIIMSASELAAPTKASLLKQLREIRLAEYSEPNAPADEDETAP